MVDVMQMLQYDAEDDLRALLRGFVNEDFPIIPTELEPHFGVARRRSPEFLNHDTILSVSVGGSNTKVLLGRMDEGTVVVERVKTQLNPTEPTPLFDYLDELLLRDAVIADYLRNHPRTWMGVSLAVGIDEGVPWHPTKVPGIIGLVSRDVEKDRETHHFGQNLERYFEERGVPCPSYIYQGDAVIAHLGAVSMTELQPDDSTILLVCGNGLATSNESEFVVTGQHCQVPDQPPLYPHSEMEDGQYQYLVAGKGLFGVMRRAALARAEEPDSQIPPDAVRKLFATDQDSRRVAAIWETTLPGGRVHESAEEVRGAVGDAAYAELQELSGPIMDRGISVLANCVLGTIAWMGRAPSGSGHDVFLEGSVALNPPTLARMTREVLSRLESPVFAGFGMETPLAPQFLPDVRRLAPAGDMPDHEADQVDVTMIGALAMAAAEDILREE